MDRYNIDVLLEKTNRVQLGIRAKQSGITLKEYFLNQERRANDIYKSQKVKLNQAISRLLQISKVNDTNICKFTIYSEFTNKAGKTEKKLICSNGMTYKKCISLFKNVISEIYSTLKYRCSEIMKCCRQGLRDASKIIKGKVTSEQIANANKLKSDVSQLNLLVSDSLKDMRNCFKSIFKAIK